MHSVFIFNQLSIPAMPKIIIYNLSKAINIILKNNNSSIKKKQILLFYIIFNNINIYIF